MKQKPRLPGMHCITTLGHRDLDYLHNRSESPGVLAGHSEFTLIKSKPLESLPVNVSEGRRLSTGGRRQ